MDIETCDCGRMVKNADCGREVRVAPQCPYAALSTSGVQAQSQAIGGK